MVDIVYHLLSTICPLSVYHLSKDDLPIVIVLMDLCFYVILL